MIALNEEFGIEKLRGVCDNATSRIYGFIMYTRKHSYIVKVFPVSYIGYLMLFI